MTKPNELKACLHTWPNMISSTQRKCMRCGMKECDAIGEGMKDAFKAIGKELERRSAGELVDTSIYPAPDISVNETMMAAWRKYAVKNNINTTIKEMVISGHTEYEHLYTDGCYKAFLYGMQTGLQSRTVPMQGEVVKALRALAIKDDGEGTTECAQCNEWWHTGDEEIHDPKCLAASLPQPVAEK